MRLSTPVETTDPDSRLFSLTQVTQILIQNSIKSLLVCAFTNEALELPLECGPISGVLRCLNLRDTKIRYVTLGRISRKDIPVHHRHDNRPFSAEIRTA